MDDQSQNMGMIYMPSQSKVIETDTHIFFLTGPYSNWHPAAFHGKLAADGPTLLFNCSEQYLMAAKAHQFNDQKTFDAIMNAAKPRDQKMLGRAVGGFTVEQWEKEAKPIWDIHARPSMFRGLWYKQLENEEYRDTLMSGTKYLVEGNKDDTIWAVGLSWDDPAILVPANWNGTNWLGLEHMSVRHRVTKVRQLNMILDPWTMTMTPGEPT